jgi:hypothetical protein
VFDYSPALPSYTHNGDDTLRLTSYIFRLEGGHLYQRVNNILTSHPYGLSLIDPTFMMTDEVIQILVITLLFSCKCNRDLSVVSGRHEAARVVKYKITLKHQLFKR